MNGRHSEQAMRAWGPTAAAAVVSCLPPVALAAGLSGAGFGLALDSTPLAASGAVAATVGIVAERSAGRRLRRRLRQERARNRLEVHDLHLRLEQATRHLAEAVALAEAATRAMSGAPLVLAQHGQAVLDAAAAAAVAPAVPVAAPVVAVAETPAVAAEPVVDVEQSAEPLPALPRRVPAPVPPAEPLPAAAAAGPLPAAAGPLPAAAAAVFGHVVVPATPADLFTPANGLPVPAGEHDWFAPVRPGGLPPAPQSPAVGIGLGVAAAAAAAPAGRPAALVTAGAGRPPGQREPVSGSLPVLVDSRAQKLPARLADAKVVDLSLLAGPQETGLIVVRRGRHAADHVA